MKKENSDNTSKNIQIEEFLSERYEFRYNSVLHRAEYRPRGTDDYTAIDRPYQYPQTSIGQGSERTDLA